MLPNVVKVVFLLLVYYSFFSRTVSFIGLTGGMLSVFLASILFSICCFLIIYHNKLQISILSALIILFFSIQFLSPLISVFVFNSDPGIVVRFSLEMLAAFFMFFSTYYLVQTGYITPKFIIYSLAILCLISALGIVRDFVDITRIHRVSGLSSNNYMSNIYAFVANGYLLISYRLFHKGKKFKSFLLYIPLLLIIVVLLLMGSRQAIIAFLVGSILTSFLVIKSRRLFLYYGAGAILAALLIYFISLNIDLSGWLSRFTYENISRMVEIRWALLSKSLTDLSLIEFVFGRPDLYEQYAILYGSRYVNPHNIFVSLIRYNGIFSSFLLVMVILMVVYEFFRLRRKHSGVKSYAITESSILIFFVVVLVYTLFSGQQTRFFSLYIIMGYVAGYLEMVKTLKSDEQYQKMIL